MINDGSANIVNRTVLTTGAQEYTGNPLPAQSMDDGEGDDFSQIEELKNKHIQCGTTSFS